MKKRVLAAAIAAMCFVGTVPVSVVPIAGVAENESLEEVAIKNEPGIKDTITEFGTGGEWTNPESSDIMLKNMTLNDVIELAKKGDELDWADFKGYNGKDVGSGQDIWEYKFDDGYVLRVIGVTDKKPDYILLSRNNDKEIDIRTDDVEAFIAEMNTNNDPMSLKGTKPMALDDVKELAKKGGELTWSDFEAYSGRKCGTPFDMLAYIYEIDESYYLFVSGAVDGAPDKVQLCHYNEHISVDVLTGDVEAFIAEYSNYELPDIGYTFDEIYNMTEDEVRNVFNEKGLTATEKYHVYPQRNGNTAVYNDSMTILLYPENYMINLTGHELVSHVTDMNDRDKLFKDSDIVWDSEKVRKSLGLPEEYFNIYVESSMGVIKSAPEGEDPDIRKYCKCSIRCTSKDKDKIADLRRAALNYIQLNPDFALVYHEISGGENVLTPEKNLKGDANSNGNETCYSGGNCEDGEMIVPETEDGKTVTEVFIQFNDNVKTLKIPATVNKVDIIKCLNLVKIEVSEDNPYLCTVDGVIYSKDMKKLVFYPSSKSETEFIVPYTVEVIGEGAFSYAQNLKTVKLPDGVKIIKDSAFFGTKITDFELPETLTDIEQYAFSENNSLTSITLPASLKHAESPFLECGALTEIVILHEIGDEHFESSGPRNPDDDYYSALLRNGSNITVFVPDNSYEDYNKYYKDRWKCKNILPLSKYEKNTIKGDTNCDGTVDMADAVLIMQALANPNKYGIDGTADHHLTEQGKLNGDMDGDGLTVGDAQAIQRKLLGLDKEDKISVDEPQVTVDAGLTTKDGKRVSFGLYDKLCNNTDTDIEIAVTPNYAINNNYVYNGKTISQYHNEWDEDSALFEKYGQIVKDGDKLKYGEALYTTGTPDGEKWDKDFYYQRVSFYGEEFLAKYIVNGEFLIDKVLADQATHQDEHKTINHAYKALHEAIDAYNYEEIQATIPQLEQQNIRYEYNETQKALIFYVTATQFEKLSLDNVSSYGLASSGSVVAMDL